MNIGNIADKPLSPNVSLHSKGLRLRHDIKDDIWSSVISTDFVVIIPDCSFPYTYNGGLYYRCIENIAEVSTAEQSLACINVNYTAVMCNSPGWRKIDNYRVLQKVTHWDFADFS